MAADVRSEERRGSKRPCTLSWEEQGQTRYTRAEGSNVSPSGVGLECPIELRAGTSVYIEEHEAAKKSYGVVRHCTRRETSYLVGVELGIYRYLAARYHPDNPKTGDF